MHRFFSRFRRSSEATFFLDVSWFLWIRIVCVCLYYSVVSELDTSASGECVFDLMLSRFSDPVDPRQATSTKEPGDSIRSVELV